ncbi:polysaccharide deacetylase family protein [Rhizobium sp. AAP43]|uniref:polysaccharide deacetylase family protein n=1 Tax=Rhizobium sp. AAP43 TaxID=1523420 RepID=UPI0006B8A368|nr:polysaccharide deacetylase family protein [Rhizobium sp. AAP43]KPF46478.1 polysaccharide deacetylase [Rhizobium sp. AAP43]
MFKRILALFLALSPMVVSPLPALAETTAPDGGKPAARPRQILLVSFDGAHDNRLWQRSRDFARRSDAKFTYFVSCTTLIPRERAGDYKAPGKKAARSNIGFAPTVEDVATRLDHIWSAHNEGHEIASHTCGHFDGKDWSREDWLREFDSFDRVMLNAWKDNGLTDREPDGWADFVRTDITGFRAPYLSAPESLFEAERAHGYRYDASTVTDAPLMPKDKKGLARFGLPLIPEGPKGRKIIAMDYNLFIRHSAGMDHPSKADEFAERSYKAFRAAFDNQYDGDRIPLQIGLHFVEMNGGAYWTAMERLVSEVCHLPDVACVTYSEALAMMADDRRRVAQSGQ